MVRYVGLFIVALLFGCSNYGQLTYITKLPKKLDENSGIVSLEPNKIWVIEDNGNEDKIYEVSFEGKMLRSLKVKNAKNKDWEDLAKDDKGNLYIGDFGNNNNDRTDLVIYKIPNPQTMPGDSIIAEKIKFNYPEQKAFPPKAAKKQFDTEALFYYDTFLYIITKDRSDPFLRQALVYKVPSTKGTYDAQLIGTFNTCVENPIKCEVTGAAISPDGKKIVLLGYGVLWVITDFSIDTFANATQEFIDLGVNTQLESVCFIDNTTILLSDEERRKTGRNLYSLTLSN
ncbi:MAG: hypothetical protein HKN52_07935 [Eudoraea sp.]|nr:hypothetical protein [Eudoraea sp.]